MGSFGALYLYMFSITYTLCSSRVPWCIYWFAYDIPCVPQTLFTLFHSFFWSSLLTGWFQVTCPQVHWFSSLFEDRDLNRGRGTDSDRPFSLQGREDWSHVGVARWQQRVGTGRDILLIWWSTKRCRLCASPSLLFWRYLRVQICIFHLETPLSELWISILHPSLPKAAQLLTPAAPNQKFSPPEFPIACGLGALHHNGSRQKLPFSPFPASQAS